MKIIQYGVFAGLMMASMMPVAQAEDITPLRQPQTTTYQFSAGSLPTMTMADKILVTPAPTVTLSNGSPSAEVPSAEVLSSKSVSNPLVAVDTNGKSVKSGQAQVIFRAP